MHAFKHRCIDTYILVSIRVRGDRARLVAAAAGTDTVAVCMYVCMHTYASMYVCMYCKPSRMYVSMYVCMYCKPSRNWGGSDIAPGSVADVGDGGGDVERDVRVRSRTVEGVCAFAWTSAGGVRVAVVAIASAVVVVVAVAVVSGKRMEPSCLYSLS